jgi:hypothetical protein
VESSTGGRLGDACGRIDAEFSNPGLAHRCHPGLTHASDVYPQLHAQFFDRLFA